MATARAVITGAAGFIGSWAADIVAEAGVEPIPLVRGTSDLTWLEGHRNRLRTGDVTDPDSLYPVLRGARWVLHVAGVVRARSAEAFDRVNSLGTRHVLETAYRACPDVERIVVVSSLAAAGPSPDGVPITEDADPRPITAYGRSKLRGEEWARRWSDRLPVVIVRPPAVYGPRDRGIHAFFRCARLGFLPRFGRGDRSYSLVHGEDLARALWATATHPVAAGRTYFVCDPAPYSWEALLQAFAAVFDHPVRTRTIPAWVLRSLASIAEVAPVGKGRRPFLTRDKVGDLLANHWVCSPRRIREELGFECTRGLEAGLASTAAWYRKAGWLPADR